MAASLEAIVEWAFGGSDSRARELVHLGGLALKGAPDLSRATHWVDPTIAEYRHGVDFREARIQSHVRTSEMEIMTVAFSGRQIGALGVVIPAGRRFSSFANVTSRRTPGAVMSYEIESGFLGDLTGSGFRWFAGAMISRGDAGRQRGERLNGNPEATLWATAWRLPPRLARLGVLLMAGFENAEISTWLSLTKKSVSTYTEQLFEHAGIDRRSQLRPAALRASRRHG